MLSSQTPQRLSPSHRRQNSTPTTSKTAATKASYPPATHTNQQPQHRRGLSVDFAMLTQGRQFLPQQENGTVLTNQGPYQQHNMRATQMPAMSRPGQQNIYFEEFQGQSTGSDQQPELFNISEAIDPQFDLFGLDSVQTSNSGAQSNAEDANDFFLHLERASRIGSSPQTPKSQQNSDCCTWEKPLTDDGQTRRLPDNTPQNCQGSNATIKASRLEILKREPLAQDSFALNRKLSNGLPSPINMSPSRSGFNMDPIPSPTFLDVSDLDMDFSACVNEYSSSNYSPTTNRASPTLSSFQSSPELAPMSLFGNGAEPVPRLSAAGLESCLSASPNAYSPKRKSKSPKKAPASSCQSEDESAFNPMDYIINDTGITEEEINAHIQGPDPSGKYSCLYEGCKNGLFGRKENIRAHVQTHLDDRRFRCDVCYNRFVRPNDLKRHWNIHLNKRDFKCICKAAFNRHDALKRHRERSEWCESGGTRGSPDLPKKEEKKRGRPKKIAPTETQERRDRKALIRRQVLKKKASAPSSVASSRPSPPPDFYVPELQRYQPMLNSHASSMASFTPPTSPGHNIGDIFSSIRTQSSYTPKDHSLSPPPTRGSTTSSYGRSNSSVSDAADLGMDLFGEADSYANSPPKSNASQYGTPPELDLSSSPAQSRFMDFGSSDESDRIGQSSQEIDIFADMLMKTASDGLDNMYPLFDSNPHSFMNPKSSDLDVFRDTIHDELDDPYWVPT